MHSSYAQCKRCPYIYNNFEQRRKDKAQIYTNVYLLCINAAAIFDSNLNGLKKSVWCETVDVTFMEFASFIINLSHCYCFSYLQISTCHSSMETGVFVFVSVLSHCVQEAMVLCWNKMQEKRSNHKQNTREEVKLEPKCKGRGKIRNKIQEKR